MKLRKLLPTFVGALALCAFLPLMPQDGQAAEVTSIDTPQVGDTQLWVTFTNGQPTDRYEIYVNGSLVNSGVLGSEVTNPDRMFFYLTYVAPDGTAQRPVQAGDSIELRMQKGDEMITHQKTVASSSTPHVPSSMKAESSTVAPGDAVFASLVFDSAYVPDPDDRILVMAYDSADKNIDMYSVDLPDVYDGSVKVQLKNTEQTAYYLLTFVTGGDTIVNLPTVRIDVKEGSTPGNPSTPSEPTDDEQELINNATSMTFTYPSNTVALGESVTPTIKLVDAAGNAHDYTGPVTFSYSGDAVSPGTFDANGRFTVASDQSYIGSVIRVTAIVGPFSCTVDLTVQAGDKSLILTPDSGSMGNARAVSFQLADGAGNRLRLVWEPTVAEVVIKPSDPNSTAKMAGAVTSLSALTTTGSGTLLISSDQIAEADIYIIFRDGSGRFYQTALTHFNFTENTGEGDLTLQLTIGSSTYTVNGISATTDTQPVVQNGRTYVPYRMLAEVLGGTVDFDEKTQTITTVYGGTSIIMTVGSDTYTINGNQKEMDAVPFINADNRTMVPLRVMAEAFGCTVTPQYAANGTTTVGVIVER